MRSAPIARPAPAESEPVTAPRYRPRLRHHPRPRHGPRGRARALPLLALSGLVLATLAGCASGDARDSALAATRAATEGARFPARQATFVQSEYGGTPTLVPTVAVEPALQEIAITIALRPDGSPDGIYGSVPANAGVVYAAARISNLRADQLVTAEWQRVAEKPADRIAIGYSEQAVTGTGEQWVGLPLGLDGSVAPDVYAVYIAVDGVYLNSISFRITASGSGPQRIA